MARKPNYQFERQERDRLKAAKKAHKAAAKRREREANDEAVENADAGLSLQPKGDPVGRT